MTLPMSPTCSSKWFFDKQKRSLKIAFITLCFASIIIAITIIKFIDFDKTAYTTIKITFILRIVSSLGRFTLFDERLLLIMFDTQEVPISEYVLSVQRPKIHKSRRSSLETSEVTLLFDFNKAIHSFNVDPVEIKDSVAKMPFERV